MHSAWTVRQAQGARHPGVSSSPGPPRRVLPAATPPTPGEFRNFPAQEILPQRTWAAGTTLRQHSAQESSPYGGPVQDSSSSSRSLQAFPSTSRCQEDALRDLLAREKSRDAEVKGLRREVGELRDLLRSLVRKPGDSSDEEELSESLEASSVLSWAQPSPRSLELSPHYDPQKDGLRPVTRGGNFGVGRENKALSHPLRADSDLDCDDRNTKVEPPSTMYAYCVFVISESEHFWNLWETWYLALMVACQVVLVFTYNMSEGLKTVNEHMKPFFTQYMEELVCHYAPFVFHNRPTAFIAAVGCSLVIVMCYLRLLDRGTLNAVHPEPRTTGAKHLVNFAWFIQAIWLPAMFCGSTAWLLWGSRTPQSVVMNSVGLAYLLEADEYMYSAFVPASHKAKYVKAVSAIQKHFRASDAVEAENSLFLAALLQCCIMILYMHGMNYLEIEGLYYVCGLWLTSTIFMAFYAVRASYILILQPSREVDGIYVLAPSDTANWKFVVGGFSLYILLALLSAPKTLYPPLTYSCASSWQASITENNVGG